MLNSYEKTIYNATILTMNSNDDIIKNGFLTIKGNIITNIGKGKPKNGINLYDAKGQIIIPGLINTHTHLAMTMFRGIADDIPLKEWLEKHIWPAEKKYAIQSNISKYVRLGLNEMIRTGTTTFCDMYFFADTTAKETEKAGLRAVINEAIIDFPTNSYKNTKEAFAKNTEFIKKWQNNQLITPAILFHSTYSCNKDTLLHVLDISKKYNLIISTHISETEDEVKNSIQHKQCTPTEYLHNLNILTDKTIAAHCVWLTENDQTLFAKQKSSITHCPTSNLKLGSGIAPIPEYINKNINISIGTDGCASNNNLDMIEEMRLTALIHKGVNHNPTLITAKDTLKMATINGAKALGLDDKIGSIEIGKCADILLIDTNNTFMQPIYDYYSAIVYSMNSSCINSVIIDGKLIMKDKIII
jgi:5-methylthioadenosine/S-adenosylhomocysteine deaminase